MIDQSTVPNFQEIFDQYNGKIYGYVYLRLGKDRAVAEDLSQEIFIKAWQNIAKYNAKKATLTTWLYTIARNSLIDYFRKAKAEKTSLDENTDLLSSTAESEIEQSILSDFVYTKLRCLSHTDQDLVTWRFVQGLEITEIAQIINKSPATTTVAIHRAINKLRDIVNGQA